jgi:carbonic anhydrase
MTAESTPASAASPADALDLLSAGNARFEGAIDLAPDRSGVRAELVQANPYAIVLGCSDSRVPPEIVFDETLGRLFVVRVASGVLGLEEMGSIEYALARWSCPLVVVLGHTQCGGIAASLDRLPPGAEPQPGGGAFINMGWLVSSIRSAMGDQSALRTSADPWREAVELHVRKTVRLLIDRSEAIRSGVAEGRLVVAGAIYDVETGRVQFLDRG